MSGSCSRAPVAVPPEGALDPRGQRPGRGGGQVGRQRVGRAEVVADDRVLPGGDAAGVQVLLREQQPATWSSRVERGNVAAHQAGGAFVQGALRRCRRRCARSCRPAGLACAASMPASFRARELAQAPWPSRLVR